MSAAAGQEAESDIPPALTPNEWANVQANPNAQSTFVEFARDIGRAHAVLALANEYLHSEDPRKLTREHVSALRDAAGLLAQHIPVIASDAAPDLLERVASESELYSQLLELADVIESYLPPVS